MVVESVGVWLVGVSWHRRQVLAHLVAATSFHTTYSCEYCAGWQCVGGLCVTEQCLIVFALCGFNLEAAADVVKHTFAGVNNREVTGTYTCSQGLVGCDTNNTKQKPSGLAAAALPLFLPEGCCAQLYTIWRF